MTFIAIYLITGIFAYAWLARKTKSSSSEYILIGEGIPSLLFCLALWPVAVPLFLKEGLLLDEENKKRKNQKEYVPEDLSLFHGKLGITKTPQSPSGKIIIEEKEYESQSIHNHIEKGMNVRVVGHSMRHLKIEPAEPVGVEGNETLHPILFSH